MSVENVFSNENYINKDFQQVYQEVVDTIGKLNNKYLVDGEGDESDPMVILIKCLAGAVDKLSYNTDKNILENYPETLQQEISARRVFSPVYNMKWYMSAHGEIVIQNLKEANAEENDDGSLEIPQFLMVSSGDNDFIYTITKGDTLGSGEIKVFPVTEGKIKTLTINGSDQITIDKFVDNKIYLDDYNVAENGIFVTPYNLINNQDTLSYVWEQVDNLDVADWRTNSENGGQYYEFRVDLVTGRPYLRFVDDLVDKIGDGLRIRYILSNGENGNISAGKLTNVYATDAETTVDSEQLKILNLTAILNGENPESIESARHNYFKNIDICNTLVTLRDYANAIYLGEGLVSNCFVCDKNNDVQYSYKISTANGDITKYEETGSNDLTVYNLKFYGLAYDPIADTNADTLDDEKAEFTHTFEIINPIDIQGNPINIPQNIENYIEDIKSINHEFSSIRNENRISMIKDYYTLSINLLFRQQLSEEQQNDVKNNVITALYKNLNSHALDFGERVTYNKVQEIIYGADQRILGASIYGLDDVNFKANAVFWSPYIPVAYYPLGDYKMSAQNGDYAVFRDTTTPTTYNLMQFDNNTVPNVWTLIGSFDSTQARQYDLSNATGTLFAYYGKNKLWYGDYTRTSPSGSIKVCMSEPTTRPDTQQTVYVVKRISYQSEDPGETIASTEYPSVPIDISTSDFYDTNKFWVEYINLYYQFEIVSTNTGTESSPVINYYLYKYDEPMHFVRNGGSSNNAGYFHESFIGSEIADGQYDSNFQINTQTLSGEFQTDIYAKSVLAGKTSIFTQNAKYSSRFNETQNYESHNIRYLKPNLELYLQNEYQLQDNEYIQVLNPELEVIANYSFYVYMGFYSTSSSKQFITIEKNQDYEIQDGDLIVFYYRASDEDNYSYNVYNDGNIICPSKKITLYNLPVNRNARGLTSGIAPNYWNAEISRATKENITANRLTALKSTDSCDVKKKQENSIEYYSFVSGNRAEGSENIYYLDFIASTVEPNIAYCVLEDGDSFSVYDDKKNLITILGSGSIIAKQTDTQLVSSIGSIEQADEPMSYMLCNIEQIEPKSFVKPIFHATVTSPATTGTPPTYSADESSQQAFDSASAINKVALSSEQTNETLSVANNKVSVPQNIISIIRNQISYTDWSFGDTETVDIVVKYTNVGNTETIIYFVVPYTISPTTHVWLDGSFQPYTSDYVLQYRSPTDSEYTTIQYSAISGFTKLIRSALSIDINKDPQEIKAYWTNVSNDRSKQSVSGYGIDGTESFSIESNVEINNPESQFNEIYYLSTNDEIRIIGGKQQLPFISNFHIATQRNDVWEEIIGPPTKTVATIDYQSSIITFYPHTSDVSVELTIPYTTSDTGYVMYFSISANDANMTIEQQIDEDTFEAVGSIYGEMYGGNAYHFVKNSKYSIMASGSVLKITNKSHNTKVKLSFDPVVYPYSYKPEFGADSESITNIILNRMGELDTDNQYQLKLNKDYVVDNPLASSSFLNKDHPYNPFTICQMNPDVQWR